MGEQRFESSGGPTRISSRGLLSGGFHETQRKRMADPAPLPLDSLHCVLAYVETENTLYEEANNDRRLDAVNEHAVKLREWLSGVEPGGAIAVEGADAAMACFSSQTPASWMC
jgi:hypothetical protein